MSLPTAYQSMIHLSRYARWLPEEGRRETWFETVDRYITFFQNRHPDADIPWEEIRDAILNLDVMPSMRALMTAGPALERSNVAGYNCSYLAIDETRAFSEALYILMCGTGVGFSVESQYVEKLPVVPSDLDESGSRMRVVFGDSKEGWAEGFNTLIEMLYDGIIPECDLSQIRPAGARLKVFGGRASGPEPLQSLIDFTVDIFQNAKGRRLKPVECHDIMCKVGEVVVVGGVRRSALISLSDIDDHDMRRAKSGAWWEDNPQRALANNSAVHTRSTDYQTFMGEWQALVESGSGERGIFSRDAASIPERREMADFGTNPCSEIVLRNKQFCNLTEIVVRADDDVETLRHKAKIATIIGTLQSGLDKLPFLSEEWEKNTKEERLLGVSMTGICDNTFLSTPSQDLAETLSYLRSYCVEINKVYTERIGIEASAAITCVKPSGTVSQLVDAASGIHPRFAHQYIRRVRMDKKDPLAHWMQEKGIPCEDDFYGSGNLVFSFPQRAPQGAKVTDDFSAIQQLELWSVYQKFWCEHKPSVTIYVGPTEWDEVGEWVWQNRQIISGVSFLPRTEHTYQQAPYEAIDVHTFLELSESMPDVEFSSYREVEDNTESMQTLACTGGSCEI